MKKTLLYFLFGIMPFLSFTQDSISVLFIGNSYTSVNNLPAMIDSVATSFGDKIFWAAQTPGGATLQMQAGTAGTYVNINSQPWDFVVLQAQSQEPSFPDTQVDAETIPYAIQLADSVYSNRFCSEVQFYMTWGRRDGDPQWAPISTFEGMNSRLRAAYLRMADSVQGSVSPVGSAWAYVRANNPTLGTDLYMSDGSHPSVSGSYLAACTFYASLFRKDPVGCVYTAGLPQGTVDFLQNAASMTVLDSMEQWNVRPVWEHTQADFSITLNDPVADFANFSTKAQSYLWDFGDGSTSADVHPTHTYSAAGTYTVSLVATSECDQDTVSMQLTVQNASLDELTASFLPHYLGHGVYQFSDAMNAYSWEVYSVSGQRLVVPAEAGKVDLSAEGHGLYLLVASDGAHSFTCRLPYLTE